MYLYDEPYQEIPIRFWLLAEVSALTILDETNPLIEIAFENDLVFLNFEKGDDLHHWFDMLEKAKTFKADEYFSGEMITEVKEVILVMDLYMILTLNMNYKGIITRHDIIMISSIVNINLSSQSPECSLVSS